MRDLCFAKDLLSLYLCYVIVRASIHSRIALSLLLLLENLAVFNFNEAEPGACSILLLKVLNSGNLNFKQKLECPHEN